MKRVFLFAALAIFVFGCNVSRERSEAYVNAVSRIRALGLVTTEEEARRTYKGGSTSTYYRISNLGLKLACKIRKYRRGANRAQMAGYLRDFAGDAKQFEKAAADGSIPAQFDVNPLGEMPDGYLSMLLAGDFFRARAIYRAESGALKDAAADIYRIVSIDKQLSIAPDNAAPTVSVRLARDVGSAAQDVAALCGNNDLMLSSLQRAVAEVPPPNFRSAIGYNLVSQKKICDLFRSGKYTLDALGIAGKTSISSADVDLAESTAAEITADVAEVFPDRNKIAAIKIPEADGPANAVARNLVIDVFALADAQLTKAALQEMGLIGLDAVRKRAKAHKWDLTAITTSSDAFEYSGPYRAVATENSLQIYSVGKNGKDDAGKEDDLVGFDYKEG